jgi:hypothetical protein
MAAYFSFRFQYSRNSVLQMPTNTAKYGMISASCHRNKGTGKDRQSKYTGMLKLVV